MEGKITTLIENTGDEAGLLACEHGLSLYIEFDSKRILFDTGQTGAFADNARLLGKPLMEADCVVLSHGHYDHSGGVPRLLQELQLGDEPSEVLAEGAGKLLPMYIGAEFFYKKYKHLSDGTYRYNGNPFEEELLTGKVALQKVTEDITYLSENIMLFKNFPGTTDFEKLNVKFVVDRREKATVDEGASDDGAVGSPVWAEGLERDDFRDELALGLRTTKGLVLVVGCSHVGVVNILKAVTERTGEKIYCVLGGTHLIEADEERLEKTVDELKKLGIRKVAVSHCTGEAGMERVARAFGQDFVVNNTGHFHDL